MTIWLRILIVVALLCVASNNNAQELVKTPVQIPAITPAATAFAVARDRGYYRQEGLDAQLIVMPSALGTQALLGGNVKFSTAGGAGLLPILRGAPIRFMFTTFSRPMFWLYSRSDIRSVENLKGKKVGVSSLGSGPDSLLREILKKHGLDGGRDVAIMPVGSGTARFFALQAGTVEAAMLSIPANLMAQDAGFRELDRASGHDKRHRPAAGVRSNVSRKVYPGDAQRLYSFPRSTIADDWHFDPLPQSQRRCRGEDL